MTSIPNDDGAVSFNPNCDKRPARGSWCPGNYMALCSNCRQSFVGDKRAAMCADCAYIGTDRPDDERLVLALLELNTLREALAAARGAMEVQDERERAAGERCGVSQMERGCDWPDAVADLVIHLRKQRDEAIAERDALSASQGVMVGVLREAREELEIYTRFKKDDKGELRADHSYVCPAKRIDAILAQVDAAKANQ